MSTPLVQTWHPGPWLPLRGWTYSFSAFSQILSRSTFLCRSFGLTPRCGVTASAGRSCQLWPVRSQCEQEGQPFVTSDVCPNQNALGGVLEHYLLSSNATAMKLARSAMSLKAAEVAPSSLQKNRTGTTMIRT